MTRREHQLLLSLGVLTTIALTAWEAHWASHLSALITNLVWIWEPPSA
jgi:hypothetical protein